MRQLEPHANKIWLNGLDHLTDSGQLRLFKIGLKLRQKYRLKLKAHSSKTVMALSSNAPRCIESMKYLLRAFYNFETTMENGLKQIKIVIFVYLN